MQPINPQLPLFDQNGRRAEIISVSQLALEFPISAFVKIGGSGKSPMSFDRFGTSRKGPALYLTNSPSGARV
jgi:hypothetical protein